MLTDVYKRFLAGEEVEIWPQRGTNAVPIAFNPNTGLVYASSWNLPRIVPLTRRHAERKVAPRRTYPRAATGDSEILTSLHAWVSGDCVRLKLTTPKNYNAKCSLNVSQPFPRDVFVEMFTPETRIYRRVRLRLRPASREYRAVNESLRPAASDTWSTITSRFSIT